MGKRRRPNDLNADGGFSTPVEGKGMAGDEVKIKRGKRNRREVTAFLVNDADIIAERDLRDAVVTGGGGRKRKNKSIGKQSARQIKEKASFEGGEAGAKASFSWTSAKEIMVLSEIVRQASTDTGHNAGRSGVDWVQLAATVGGQLGCKLTRRQVYEKVRRMRDRYTKIHNSNRKLYSFKNDDDERMYTLSDQVWGGTTEAPSSRPKEGRKGGQLQSLTSEKLPKRSKQAQGPTSEKLPKRSKQAQGPLGALRLHLEDECDLTPNEEEKQASDQNSKDEDENTSPNDVQQPVMMPRGSDSAHPSDPNQGTTAAVDEQANPDLDVASQSKAGHALEADIQKTIQVFRAEHEAVLKELEKRCATVVENMQTKLSSMMSSVRGSQVPWFGSGGGGPTNLPSFGIVTEVPVPFMWDKLIDNCVSTSSDKPAALENLYEQWQQQRLQELKLTSMRLHLMMEDCKMEQEKLEKLAVKPN